MCCSRSATPHPYVAMPAHRPSSPFPRGRPLRGQLTRPWTALVGTSGRHSSLRHLPLWRVGYPPAATCGKASGVPNRQDELSTHESFMRLALAEAVVAEAARDVPVGAIVVDASGLVIARGHNRREADQELTAHAEIDALRRASAALNHWRLEGATLYVTLEPCAMCAGALVNARVARLVYGCADPKAGAVDTRFAIGQDPRLNHEFEVVRGVLADACGGLLKQFFSKLRRGSAVVERLQGEANLGGKINGAQLVASDGGPRDWTDP